MKGGRQNSLPVAVFTLALALTDGNKKCTQTSICTQMESKHEATQGETN